MWRQPDEAWNAGCFQGAVEHVGIGVMIWGAVWHDGKSDLIFNYFENNLNGEKYNSILEQALLPLFNVKLGKK